MVPDVTPVATVNEHCVPGTRMAVVDVKAIFALAAPELLATAVNSVVPQLVSITADKDEKAHDGNFSVMTSLTLNATFSANPNEICDGASVTSFSIEMRLKVTAGVGLATAVDFVTAVVAALAAFASVAATVRPLSSAFWAKLLVMIPAGMITIHWVSGLNAAVLAVRISAEVAAPVFSEATVKVVLPHPDSTGVPRVPHVEEGMTILTVSSTRILAFDLKE